MGKEGIRRIAISINDSPRDGLAEFASYGDAFIENDIFGRKTILQLRCFSFRDVEYAVKSIDISYEKVLYDPHEEEINSLKHKVEEAINDGKLNKIDLCCFEMMFEQNIAEYLMNPLLDEVERNKYRTIMMSSFSATIVDRCMEFINQLVLAREDKLKDLFEDFK